MSSINLILEPEVLANPRPVQIVVYMRRQCANPLTGQSIMSQTR